MKAMQRIVVIGAALSALLIGTPVLAQHSSSGGHAAGGGGHFAGHASAARASGGRYAAARSYSGARSYSAAGYAHPSYARSAPVSNFRGGGVSAYARAPGYVGGRVWPGFHRGYWGGGYWGGGFWPAAYYGPNFLWFLPVLPALCTTFWWGDVPYYYTDGAYYTWNPDYSGYVATDPPPTQDSGDAAAPPQGAAAGAPPDASAAAPQGPVYSDGANANGGAQIFMYPKNGQSDEQQTTDRAACQRWASTQTAGDASDFRRAMLACLDGRGYSTN